MDDAGGSFFVGFLGIPEGLFSDLVPCEILDGRRFQGVLALDVGGGGVAPFPFLPPRRPLEGMVSINSTIT
jgi:hypothetical protein